MWRAFIGVLVASPCRPALPVRILPFHSPLRSIGHSASMPEVKVRHQLGQPKWISRSEQHFGWIRGGAGGESDRRVGLNRMGKMTPDIKPKPESNPKPRTDRVVWAK